MSYERLTKKFNAELIKNSKDIMHRAYCRLADLEDKIENGTLVEVPKIGGKFYGVEVISNDIRRGEITVTRDIYESTVESIDIEITNKGVKIYCRGEDGKYGECLTKEEAEAKLKEWQS